MVKLLVDPKELLGANKIVLVLRPKGAASDSPHADDSGKTPRVRPRTTNKVYALFGKKFGLTKRHARVLLGLYVLYQQHHGKLPEHLSCTVYRRLFDTADPLALTTMASMTVALTELQRREYLCNDRYGFWSLTDEGIRVSQELQRSWEAISHAAGTVAKIA